MFTFLSGILGPSTVAADKTLTDLRSKYFIASGLLTLKD